MAGIKKIVIYCVLVVICVFATFLIKGYLNRVKSDRITDFIELRFKGEEIEKSKKIRYRKDIINLNDDVTFLLLPEIEKLVRSQGYLVADLQYIVDDLMRSITKNQESKVVEIYRYLFDLQDGYPVVFCSWAYANFPEVTLQEDLSVYLENKNKFPDLSQFRMIGDLEAYSQKNNRSLCFSDKLKGFAYKDEIQREIIIGSFSYYKKKFLYEDNQSLRDEFAGFVAWLDLIRDHLPNFSEYDDEWYDEGDLDSVDKMIVSYMSMFDISLSYDRAEKINPNMHLWTGSFLRGLRVVISKGQLGLGREKAGFDSLDWYFKEINNSSPEMGFDTFKNIRALMGYHGIDSTLQWLDNGNLDVKLKKKKFHDAYMSER